MKHEDIFDHHQKQVFQKIVGQKDPYPICIELHPTDMCNHSCPYCFHGGKGFGKERSVESYLSMNDYEIISNELKYLGIKTISLSGGGEPFLFRNFLDLLKLLHRHDMSTRIVSNGNFIHKNAIKTLLDCQEIRISIDSDNAQTYSRLRRVQPVLFGRMTDSLTNLVKERNKHQSSLSIGVTFIIGNDNYHQLEKFAKLMIDEIGVDMVIYKHDLYGGFKVHSDQIQNVNERLRTLSQRYGSQVCVRPALGTFISGKPCVMSYFKAVINPCGELFSCCLGSQPNEKNGYKFGSLKSEIDQGNQQPLQAIWKKTRKIRKQMMKCVHCAHCNFTDRKINNHYYQFIENRKTD